MVNKFSKIVVLVFLLANLGMAEYIKKDDAVYYMDKISQTDERKVEDADFKTFVELNDIYGKDSKNVFCIDKKLEDADVKTFQVIGEVNGKDKKYIYNYDEKMEINPKDFKLYKNKDKLLYFRNNGKLYIGGSFFEVEYVQDLDSFEAIDESYSKDRYNIYYAGTPIYDVDKSTFQIIMPDYYAKDKNNVYSGSDKIKDANPDTIKILNQVYLKDDKNVFLNFGQKMENVDVATFEAIEGNVAYGKDKNNIYFLGEKIKGADVKSFEVILEPSDLVQMYSKDKNSVFIGGRKIKEADSKTFERLPKTTYYSKDKNNLYYREVKIDKIDNKTLKILYSDGIDVVKNRNRIFAEGKKLNIKSPETFEIILSKYYNFPNFIYGKDDKNVYAISKFDETYSSKIIKNADVNSFEVMKNSMYTKDKNNIYFTHSDVVQMKNVDKDSFTIGENGFSHDKNSVYFYGKKLDRISPQGFKIIDFTVNSGDSEKIAFLTDSRNLYKFTYGFDDERYNLKNIKLSNVTNVKVDAPSFELVKEYTGSYYRDKNNVFYYDMNKKELKKVEGSDRNSFVEMDNFFAKDNKKVYYLGKQIENISSEGFKFVGSDIVKNKNGVYFWKDETGTGDYEIVPLNFDSASFDIANKNTSNYFKDKNGIYYLDYGKLLNSEAKDVQNAFIKLEGADIPTFKAFGYGYSKDKNRAYCKYKEFKGVDVSSFTVVLEDEGVVVKDKNRVYKNDCEWQVKIILFIF